MKTTDLIEGGLVVSPKREQRRRQGISRDAYVRHTGSLLVTHKPNIVDALDVKEGEASLFRPEDRNYTLVGRIQMGEWPCVAMAGG